MKKSILKLGKVLEKLEQKEVNGGNVPKSKRCRYYCSGTTQILVGGQGPECYLYFPYSISNSHRCGGKGNEGSGEWA